MRRSAVWLAIVPILCPAGAAAQRAAFFRDSALKLGAAIHARQDSLLTTDSTTRNVARRGDLVAMASRGLETTAVAAMMRVAAARDHVFSSASPAAGGFHLVLRLPGVPGDGPGMTVGDGQVVLAASPDSVTAPHEVFAVRGDRAADLAVDAYGDLMIGSVAAVSKWLETPSPLSTDEQERQRIAYYALATSTGASQRGCAAGDLGACAVALLIITPSPPGSGPAYSPYLRTELLLATLSESPPGAWTRLRSAADSGASIGVALSAAGAAPLDTVLARWRGELLRLRPKDGPLSAGNAFIALVWCVAALLLAIGGGRWG